MHRTLAIVALLGGLLVPATSSTAVAAGDPVQCQYTGIGALCDMQYNSDLGMCEAAPAGEQQGCRNEAAGNWAMCMANC